MDLALGRFDDAVACGALAGLLIVVWRGGPTAERLARVVAECDTLTATYAGDLALVAVIEDGSPTPSLQEAAAVARAFDAHPRITSTVAVLEGRDPWLATTLDLAARMAAMRKRATQTKLCTDAREAATWLERRHTHGRTSAEFRDRLLASIELVRARVDAHAR